MAARLHVTRKLRHYMATVVESSNTVKRQAHSGLSSANGNGSKAQGAAQAPSDSQGAAAYGDSGEAVQLSNNAEAGSTVGNGGGGGGSKSSSGIDSSSGRSSEIGSGTGNDSKSSSSCTTTTQSRLARKSDGNWFDGFKEDQGDFVVQPPWRRSQIQGHDAPGPSHRNQAAMRQRQPPHRNQAMPVRQGLTLQELRWVQQRHQWWDQQQQRQQREAKQQQQQQQLAQQQQQQQELLWRIGEASDVLQLLNLLHHSRSQQGQQPAHEALLPPVVLGHAAQQASILLAGPIAAPYAANATRDAAAVKNAAAIVARIGVQLQTHIPADVGSRTLLGSSEAVLELLVAIQKFAAACKKLGQFPDAGFVKAAASYLRRLADSMANVASASSQRQQTPGGAADQSSSSGCIVQGSSSSGREDSNSSGSGIGSSGGSSSNSLDGSGHSGNGIGRTDDSCNSGSGSDNTGGTSSGDDGGSASSSGGPGVSPAAAASTSQAQQLQPQRHATTNHFGGHMQHLAQRGDMHNVAAAAATPTRLMNKVRSQLPATVLVLCQLPGLWVPAPSDPQLQQLMAAAVTAVAPDFFSNSLAQAAMQLLQAIPYPAHLQYEASAGHAWFQATPLTGVAQALLERAVSKSLSVSPETHQILDSQLLALLPAAGILATTCHRTRPNTASRLADQLSSAVPYLVGPQAYEPAQLRPLSQGDQQLQRPAKDLLPYTSAMCLLAIGQAVPEVVLPLVPALADAATLWLGSQKAEQKAQAVAASRRPWQDAGQQMDLAAEAAIWCRAALGVSQLHQMAGRDDAAGVRLLARFLLQNAPTSKYHSILFPCEWLPPWALASLAGRDIGGLAFDPLLSVFNKLAAEAILQAQDKAEAAAQARAGMAATSSSQEDGEAVAWAQQSAIDSTHAAAATEAEAVAWVMTPHLAAWYLARAAHAVEDGLSVKSAVRQSQRWHLRQSTLGHAAWWGQGPVAGDNHLPEAATQLLSRWAPLPTLREARKRETVTCAQSMAADGVNQDLAAALPDAASGSPQQQQQQQQQQADGVASPAEAQLLTEDAAVHIACSTALLHAMPAGVAACMQQPKFAAVLQLSLSQQVKQLKQATHCSGDQAAHHLGPHAIVPGQQQQGRSEVEPQITSLHPPWLHAFATARTVQLGLQQGWLSAERALGLLKALETWLKFANSRDANLLCGMISLPEHQPVTLTRYQRQWQQLLVARVAMQVLHAHNLLQEQQQQQQQDVKLPQHLQMPPNLAETQSAMTSEGSKAANAAWRVIWPLLQSQLSLLRPAPLAHVSLCLAAMPPAVTGQALTEVAACMQLRLGQGLDVKDAVWERQRLTEEVGRTQQQLRQSARHANHRHILWSIALLQDWPVALEAMQPLGMVGSPADDRVCLYGCRVATEHSVFQLAKVLQVLRAGSTVTPMRRTLGHAVWAQLSRMFMAEAVTDDEKNVVLRHLAMSGFVNVSRLIVALAAGYTPPWNRELQMRLLRGCLQPPIQQPKRLPQCQSPASSFGANMDDKARPATAAAAIAHAVHNTAMDARLLPLPELSTYAAAHKMLAMMANNLSDAPHLAPSLKWYLLYSQQYGGYGFPAAVHGSPGPTVQLTAVNTPETLEVVDAAARAVCNLDPQLKLRELVELLRACLCWPHLPAAANVEALADWAAAGVANALPAPGSAAAAQIQPLAHDEAAATASLLGLYLAIKHANSTGMLQQGQAGLVPGGPVGMVFSAMEHLEAIVLPHLTCTSPVQLVQLMAAYAQVQRLRHTMQKSSATASGTHSGISSSTHSTPGSINSSGSAHSGGDNSGGSDSCGRCGQASFATLHSAAQSNTVHLGQQHIAVPSAEPTLGAEQGFAVAVTADKAAWGNAASSLLGGTAGHPGPPCGPLATAVAPLAAAYLGLGQSVLVPLLQHALQQLLADSASDQAGLDQRELRRRETVPQLALPVEEHADLSQPQPWQLVHQHQKQGSSSSAGSLLSALVHGLETSTTFEEAPAMAAVWCTHPCLPEVLSTDALLSLIRQLTLYLTRQAQQHEQAALQQRHWRPDEAQHQQEQQEEQRQQHNDSQDASGWGGVHSVKDLYGLKDTYSAAMLQAPEDLNTDVESLLLSGLDTLARRGMPDAAMHLEVVSNPAAATGQRRLFAGNDRASAAGCLLQQAMPEGAHPVGAQWEAVQHKAAQPKLSPGQWSVLVQTLRQLLACDISAELTASARTLVADAADALTSAVDYLPWPAPDQGSQQPQDLLHAFLLAEERLPQAFSEGDNRTTSFMPMRGSLIRHTGTAKPPVTPQECIHGAIQVLSALAPMRHYLLGSQLKDLCQKLSSLLWRSLPRPLHKANAAAVNLADLAKLLSLYSQLGILDKSLLGAASELLFASLRSDITVTGALNSLPMVAQVAEALAMVAALSSGIDGKPAQVPLHLLLGHLQKLADKRWLDQVPIPLAVTLLLSLGALSCWREPFLLQMAARPLPEQLGPLLWVVSQNVQSLPAHQLPPIMDLAVRFKHMALIDTLSQTVLTPDMINQFDPDDLVQLLLALMAQKTPRTQSMFTALLAALPAVLGDGRGLEDAASASTLLTELLREQRQQQQQQRRKHSSSGPAAGAIAALQAVKAATAVEDDVAELVAAGGPYRPHHLGGAGLYRRYSWLRKRYVYCSNEARVTSADERAQAMQLRRAVSVLTAYCHGKGKDPWVLNHIGDALEQLLS